jgi:hypothetical protein
MLVQTAKSSFTSENHLLPCFHMRPSQHAYLDDPGANCQSFPSRQKVIRRHVLS